ncbi:MAG: histidinol-phosphate transaminase [Steroidobacteraceae bacterium]
MTDDNSPPQPRQALASIAPYRQGKSALAGHSTVIKLSSNESCFGPSPAAVDAYQRAAAQLHHYPDGQQTRLRHAIAAAHGINADQIVCGNGSEELIGLAIRAFVDAGDELLLTENHFVMCPIYGQVQAAKVVFAPERDDRVDVDAILTRVTSRTRAVIVANPNNPTGTCIGRTAIAQLIRALPRRVLLMLDGAYAEYVLREDFDAGEELVAQHDNLVMLRTFSKIHGLAGLRIGWMYGPPPIVEAVNRIRTPFNANAAAMAAASAAIADREHVRRSAQHNERALSSLRGSLSALGLGVTDSVANFYLLSFAALPGKSASGAARWLERRGIIPRPVANRGVDERLRITVGLDHENDAVLAALRDYIAS